MNSPFGGIVIFILGALLGSFGNVVIYRMPADQSVIKPRSRCRSCGQPIAWYDNIPILSWFLLRGRCRKCRASYSFRYPLVELITAILFLGCFWLVGWSWSLLEYLVFVWALIVCSFIDLDHMILPDEFTLSGIIIGLVGAALLPERSLLDSFLGVLMGGGFLWFMAWLYFTVTGVDGMGGGDIKLLAWIGAVLGAKAVPYVILVSAIVGSVVGIAVGWKKKEGLKTVIPFGPYLALAAVSFLFGGRTLALLYWNLFLPQ